MTNQIQTVVENTEKVVLLLKIMMIPICLLGFTMSVNICHAAARLAKRIMSKWESRAPIRLMKRIVKHPFFNQFAADDDRLLDGQKVNSYVGEGKHHPDELCIVDALKDVATKGCDIGDLDKEDPVLKELDLLVKIYNAQNEILSPDGLLDALRNVFGGHMGDNHED